MDDVTDEATSELEDLDVPDDESGDVAGGKKKKAEHENPFERKLSTT